MIRDKKTLRRIFALQCQICKAVSLTAAAVVVGSAVILFDPIFQGLAISLMAGEVASLLLSRMTVPALFYIMRKREMRRSAASSA
jgi:multidrug efflux pump subunit AcrB